jgi:hypothetical protein
LPLLRPPDDPRDFAAPLERLLPRDELRDFTPLELPRDDEPRDFTPLELPRDDVPRDFTPWLDPPRLVGERLIVPDPLRVGALPL